VDEHVLSRRTARRTRCQIFTAETVQHPSVCGSDFAPSSSRALASLQQWALASLQQWALTSLQQWALASLQQWGVQSFESSCSQVRDCIELMAILHVAGSTEYTQLRQQTKYTANHCFAQFQINQVLPIQLALVGW
jgi:hypothetical protein